MRRWAILSALGCAALLLVAGRGLTDDPDPAYGVGTLQAALAHDPSAVVGKTVRVRGTVPLPLVFGVCSAPRRAGCADERPAYLLYPAGQASGIPGKRGTLEFDYEAPSVATLPLVAGREDRLLATLRRVPLLGRVVPAAQWLRYGAAATYRVRVEAAPPHSLLCTGSPCWILVLIDPARASL